MFKITRWTPTIVLIAVTLAVFSFFGQVNSSTLVRRRTTSLDNERTPHIATHSRTLAILRLKTDTYSSTCNTKENKQLRDFTLKFGKDCVCQEPINRSVHRHCICDPTYAQIELFLHMCFPRTSVSTAVRIWPNSTLKKVATKAKSRILRPFSSTISVPFRVDFDHMRTAAETDVRVKQF